jgi:two-component system sensor histidine kinase BaeS
MRRRFFRKIALGFVLFVALLVGLTALLVELVTRAGAGRPGAILVGLALVLAAIVSVGRWIRRAAEPIGDVMEAADRVAAGDLSARVRPRGPGDVRRLGRSFNQMAERLERDEARRRELLADVAHELRTPLQVLRGGLEGVVDGLYPADREHLAPILAETTVMSRLLDDLLTLSTAEAGALELHREPVPPAVLVDDAVAAFRATADGRGVRLGSDVQAGLPEIDVDPVRVGEVLANLTANALRHTPAGGSVEVAAAAAPEGVAFEVRDTGTGIDPERIERVFERFERSPDSGGSGLGLAIAKSLVEAHGGSIDARSDPGDGTTIRFTLPGG